MTRELRIIAILFAVFMPAVPAFLAGPGLHRDAPVGRLDAGPPWVPADERNPTIEITSPEMGTILEAPTLTVTGVAWDDVALLKVEVSIDNENWTLVNGTDSWSITLVLPRGGTWISARAWDTSENLDRTGVWVEVMQRTVFESVVLPMLFRAIPLVALVGLVADLAIWQRRTGTPRGRR